MAEIEQTQDGTEPVPAAAPAPTFVPSDDFKAYQASMQSTLQSLTDTVSALTVRLGQAQTPTVADPARISRGQYVEALQTGNEAVIEAYETQREADIVARHVTPLRTQGLGAIAALNRKGLEGKAHYHRFKKEIDAQLAQVDPAAQTNPMVLDKVYAMVVGEHAQELADEAAQAAVRQASAPAAETPSSGSRGSRDTTRSGGGGSAAAPSVEDLLGADAAEALRSKGQTPDEFARRLGYTDWGAYAKLAQEGAA